MAISTATHLGLVPQRRLGALLADRRETYGYSVGDMVRKSAGRFSLSDLEAIEEGIVDLDDSAIEALSLLYEFNSAPPARQRSRLIVADDEDVPSSMGPDAYTDDVVLAVLQRYVALLYLLRSEAVGVQLALRGDDMAMLAQAFNKTDSDVEVELERIMSEDNEVVGEFAERMRRRLVVPAAGLLVGPTPAGMLVLVK
ncbi:MAG: hypothetical protein ACR2PK_09825 [Acidimicrobiales bacterium]